MNILGLSFFYHDAAAALLQDGMLLAAAEEERFSRRKHDSEYPAHAIRFCLETAKIQPSDLSPPPSSTDNPACRQIAATSLVCTGRPSIAPFKSTM